MSSILAIDYGEQRVGLALASSEARIAKPYRTLKNTPQLQTELQTIIHDSEVTQLVLGLPRSLDGNETAQTSRTRDFARDLEVHDLPIELIDEAGTSQQARQELEAKGKPYAKGDVDALAATYILEDYLREKPHAAN